MGKSNKKYRRKKRTVFPWIPVTLGLVLIGIAALAMPRTDSQAAQVSSVVPMEVSFVAPELSLVNLEGKTEALLDYRDRVVLVNNWATWCPPCKAEMPTLAQYYDAHASAGFAIIAIEAGDAREDVAQFAESYHLKFPIWLDPDGESLRAFGNGNLPNSYVIDRAGMVRYAWTGEITGAMLEKYITPLLTEN